MGLFDAIGDIGSAFIESDAIKKASKAQQRAIGEAGAVLQDEMYRTEERLSPYTQAGYGALQQQLGVLGLPTYDPNAPVPGSYQLDPYNRTGKFQSIGDVIEAFQAVLGRTPEFRQEDIKYWVGKDIEEGLMEMRQSEEYRDKLASGQLPGRETGTPSIYEQQEMIRLRQQQEQARATAEADKAAAIERGEIAPDPVRPAADFALPDPRGVGSMDEFRESPGYQFMFDEAMRGIERMGAARGLLKSGGILREAARYATGLADQEYGDYYRRDVDRYNREYGSAIDKYNRQYGQYRDYYGDLTGLRTVGANATGALTSAGGDYAANRADLALGRGAIQAGKSTQLGKTYGGALSAGISALGNLAWPGSTSSSVEKIARMDNPMWGYDLG